MWAEFEVLCSNSGLFTHLKSITQSAAILLTFEQFEQFEQFDSNSTIDIKPGTMMPTFLIEAPLRHHLGIAFMTIFYYHINKINPLHFAAYEGHIDERESEWVFLCQDLRVV